MEWFKLVTNSRTSSKPDMPEIQEAESKSLHLVTETKESVIDRFLSLTRMLRYIWLQSFHQFIVSSEQSKKKNFKKNVFLTKVVHFDTVGDMLIDTFVTVFRRFISRRGRCANLASNNGKTFGGASRILKKEIEDVRKWRPIKSVDNDRYPKAYHSTFRAQFWRTLWNIWDTF